MEIEKIHINELIPTDYNPRIITTEDYEKLNKSLETFGMVDPIIINLKNNHIIGGHQRYDVLLDKYVENNSFETLNIIRLGEIGWVFPETNLKVIDENHEKALNIALNKITGQFDEVKLNDILSEIDFDIGKLGLSIENDIMDNEDLFSKRGTDILKLNKTTINFGKYSIEISNDELEKWEDEIIIEAENNGTNVEEIIIKRLKF